MIKIFKDVIHSSLEYLRCILSANTTKNAAHANRIDLLAKSQRTIGNGYASKNISIGCTVGIDFVDKTISNRKLHSVVNVKQYQQKLICWHFYWHCLFQQF